MTEREKLIEELRMIVINEFNSEMNIHCPNYDKLADFILEDRKRIVAPLLKIDSFEYADIDTYSIDCIDETLKLAGVKKGQHGK